MLKRFSFIGDGGGKSMDEIQRLRELTERSYNNGWYTFTDFMSLAGFAVIARVYNLSRQEELGLSKS